MRVGLPLALAAAVLAALPVHSQTSQEIEQLRKDTALLRQRLELANGEKFYLALDPAASSLKLMLKGAVLQDYKVEGLEVGTPRVAFATRSLPEGWRGQIGRAHV